MLHLKDKAYKCKIYTVNKKTACYNRQTVWVVRKKLINDREAEERHKK